MFDETLSKLDELEATYKKLNLLERKESRMGLDEEEKIRLKELKTVYYDNFIILINDIVKILIETVLSEKGKKSLATIKKLVPWNGLNILTVEDFENILIASEKLNEEEIKKIEKSLNTLHLDIFKGIEIYCGNKSIYNALNEIGKSISLHKDGGIKDLIKYIDDMYKDFGEIFGIELPEIQLIYY